MDLEILNIASDTINYKDIKKHTHYSKLKNSLCGDEIKIKLIIKDEKIIDFGYQGNSCVYCQASASLLSKISINSKKNKINELCDAANKIKLIKWDSLKSLFNKKNIPRKECILLPFKTLKKIVTN